MALQELDLKIEYHPGKGNQKADALSRHQALVLTDDDIDESTPAVVAVLEALTDNAETLEREVKTGSRSPVVECILSG